MKILVINCGSSSLKYKVFDSQIKINSNNKSKKKSYNNKELLSGIIENIGTSNNSIKNHRQAIKLMIKKIKEQFSPDFVNEIKGVGHRVVHGGLIKKPQIITNKIIKDIEKNASLAPLHNPKNLIGIRESMKILNKAKHIAVFDTSFHQTIPDYAKIYPIPYKYYKKEKIQRYGFHGISHEYVLKKTSELLNKKIEKINMISCHLGNGSSITAIKNGKSVDTSMGFTPLEGLMMGTRSGDIDPGIIIYLNSQMSMKKINHMLNYESGLLGVSKISQNMDVLVKKSKKNKNAKLAIDIFCYKIKKYISTYAGIIGKIDAISICGGIGENNPIIRSKITDIPMLNIKIDNKINNKSNSKNTIISKNNSQIKVLSIKTDEEKIIFDKVIELLNK